MMWFVGAWRRHVAARSCRLGRLTLGERKTFNEPKRNEFSSVALRLSTLDSRPWGLSDQHYISCYRACDIASLPGNDRIERWLLFAESREISNEMIASGVERVGGLERGQLDSCAKTN
jgi:hypothetical protein